MKTVVDPDECISCMLCTSIAPDAFEEDDSGLVIGLDDVDDDLRDDVEEAMDACPTDAITIED